jgi:transposase
MSTPRPHKRYPSDVSDDEWAFVAPYLTLITPDGLQRTYALRDVFDAVRWVVRTGAPWRYLPGDFPPWPAVSQQARRWMEAGCFESLVQDLRLLVRVLQGRPALPSATILDGRVLQSSPESGARAGWSGHKRRKGSKVHAAVETLGHLLALVVTPANVDERTQVEVLATEVQAVTGQTVELAYVDEGDSGPKPEAAAEAQGIHLEVVSLPEAKRGFVLLPRRWVVERSFAWLSRFRRLARDYERLPSVLAGLHFLACACLMLHHLIHLYSSP